MATASISPLARRYPVPIRFAGRDNDHHIVVKAASLRDCIALERYIADMDQQTDANEIATGCIDLIAPRLISWHIDSAPVPAPADALHDLEPMEIVQLTVAIHRLQHLTYGEKKSCSSPSPSAMESSAVIVLPPVEPAPPPASICNAPPAAPPTPVATTATTSVGGPSQDVQAAPSAQTPTTCCSSPTCGAAAPCPTPAASSIS